MWAACAGWQGLPVLLLLPAALPAEISAPGRTDLHEGPEIGMCWLRNKSKIA
jgi:hypothetical protein